MHIIALDEEGERQNQEDAAKHRKGIIEKLTDFSVKSYQYVWKEDITDWHDDMVIMRLADGSQCDGEIFWFDQEFQSFHKQDSFKTIEIDYKYDGKEKCVVCSVASEYGSSCRIGLEIDSQLRLIVHLCYKNRIAKSKQIEFQFE